MKILPTTVVEAEAASLRVYQIELTNRCDASCHYCPHGEHRRVRGFMTEQTFKATLAAMQNKVVSLHHFGEPLLHPDLERLVEIATTYGIVTGFSTNGRLLTQERLDALTKAGVQWIRLHTDPFGVRRSDFVVPLGVEFTEHSLKVENDAPRKDIVSFSGYLDIVPRHDGRTRCSFLRDRWCAVLWDGRVALCCHDIEGTRDLALCNECEGYVFDSPRDWGNYGGREP